MDTEPLPELYRQLKEHVDALKVLLSNPRPSLWSWCTSVGIEVKAIADLYGTETE